MGMFRVMTPGGRRGGRLLGGERRPAVAVLDIGSTKICAVIARLPAPGLCQHGDALPGAPGAGAGAGDGAGSGATATPEILGIGHHAAEGLKAGAIVDLEAATRAIGKAVASAERHAHESAGAELVPEDIVVGLPGPSCRSRTVKVEIPVHGHEVRQATITRALARTRQAVGAEAGEIVHAMPLDFTLDGRPGIRDPLGMFGAELGVSVHLVTAGVNAVRNLDAAIGAWNLDIGGFCCAPYAAGLACLVPDERELGATVIEMGGGVTGVAVFAGGACLHTDSVPLGGDHVTQDIARGLTTPLDQAERLKVLHGSAVAASVDDGEPIRVHPVGETDPAAAQEVPQSLLTGIIQPRLEEIFELVRARLEASGFDRLAGRRVVLTGGASQLPGIAELAQLVLDKQVRLGRPLDSHGLPDALKGPDFATTAGLLGYAGLPEDTPAAMAFDAPPAAGWLGRVGHWLRENF